MRRLTLWTAACAMAACVVPPREGVHEASAFDAAAAGAMATKEIATGKDEQVMLGWGLEFVGDRARLHTCRAEDTCGMQVVELVAKRVRAVKPVGRARPVADDGSPLEEIDVVRVTVAVDQTTTRGGVASDPAHGLVVGPPPK